MKRREFALAALTVALAVVLTLFRIPVASSQGLMLAAAKVKGELPVRDFDAAPWQKSSSSQARK